MEDDDTEGFIENFLREQKEKSLLWILQDYSYGVETYATSTRQIIALKKIRV